MEFDEELFIWGLTTRPADVQHFSEVFDPSWMRKAVHQVIVSEIYKYAKEFGLPPSLTTLYDIFKDKYPDGYENKFKPVLDHLKKREPDVSQVVYTMDKARDAAITRSLAELTQSQEMIRATEEQDGKLILRRVNSWLNNFANVTDEQSASLKEAMQNLLRESVMTAQSPKIPCGIKPIDDWLNGGLRTKELGIFIAPTGHGKSAILMNMAYKMASVDELPVWFVTNELTIDEQTERFLARITQHRLTEVQVDPTDAYRGMGKHWKATENIRITSVNRIVTTNEMEAMMTRWANISGWKPKVIVVDFMERMAPNDRGYSRSQEWAWIGAIGQDLVRFAKRHNVLIWSAAQTNRAGLSAAELGLDMTQGSIRQVQEATAVIAGRQDDTGRTDENGDPEIGLELFNLKSRSSKRGKPKMIALKLATMYITNEVVEKEDDEIPDIDREKDEEDPKKTKGWAKLAGGKKNLEKITK